MRREHVGRQKLAPLPDRVKQAIRPVPRVKAERVKAERVKAVRVVPCQLRSCSALALPSEPRHVRDT